MSNLYLKDGYWPLSNHNKLPNLKNKSKYHTEARKYLVSKKLVKIKFAWFLHMDKKQINTNKHVCHFLKDMNPNSSLSRNK